MPTILLPVTRRSLPFASSLLHFASSVSSSPAPSVRFLLVATSRDLARSLRVQFPRLVAADAHEPVPDWSDTNDLREALSGCQGVLLAASGCGDDVMNNLPRTCPDEWLPCEQNVATLVSTDHRVVKLSWTDGFVGETSPCAVGRTTWEIEEELKLRLGQGDPGARRLTIVRATTGMDAFLRGRWFDSVCGRTLSTSVKRGRLAFVHPLDVAESLSALVANVAMDGRGERGMDGLVRLTGPEALTFPEVATLLSKGIGDKVHYSFFPLWAVQPARWVQGVPGDAIEEELAVLRALEAGAQQEVDTSFMETLLGRKARSLRTFIAENVAAWPRTHPV